MDFWPVFKKEDNYFVNLLKKYYEVEISNNPDYLFYSVFGCKFLEYDCIKIFFTGENIRPNFRQCDYAFSFDYENHAGKNYRLPLYALYSGIGDLTAPKDPEEIAGEKKKFCNFVNSNPRAKRRIRFYEKLSKYKKVDSGGRVLNNVGGPVADKLEFIKNYKFTIAFENESYPGYTTEKIFQPMRMNSIPIYWGNPLVNTDFNTQSFINCHEFKNDEEIIQRIIEIDKNEELYLKYLSAPWFEGNKLNKFIDEDNVIKQFKKIFDSKETIIPVSTRVNATIEGLAIRAKFAFRSIGVKDKIHRIIKMKG